MPVLVPQGVPSLAFPVGMHTGAPVPHWMTPAVHVAGAQGAPFWHGTQAPLPLQTPAPPSDAAQLTPGATSLHDVALVPGWQDWQALAGFVALAA
jgi:hypothetical protein